MAIIVSNDFITVTSSAITTSAEPETGFSVVDIFDYWHLKRRWRHSTGTGGDTNPRIRLNLGSAKTVTAVFLNDVNFNKVVIKGHTGDLGTDWSGADFTSGTITISCDAQVNRYKAYIPLTSFNYQYMAIIIPSTVTLVGSYTEKFEMGSFCILDSATTFTKNMSYGYQRGARRAYQDFSGISGHVERIELGDLRWEANVVFGLRSTTDESDLITLNNMNIAEPMVFYENAGDTSKCYLCLRDTDYMGTMMTSGIVSGTSIQFREII